MERKKEKYLIALAGLFHDIGKFYQRATNIITSPEEKGIFGHAHAALSARWIEKYKNIFEDVQTGLTDILINWGARHHNPTDELESIILQIADRYSSAHEREKILQDELNLLHAVFERINFGRANSLERTEEKNFGIYIPERLTLNKNIIFPKLAKGFIKEEETKKPIITYLENEIKKALNISSTQNINQILKEKYEKLFKYFNDEFESLSLNFTHSLEAFFNFAYYLLQICTWSIPAATWSQEDKNRHYPDISLFDHSRVLSAIATSLYDYALEKGIKPSKNTTEDFDEEKAFVLIEGDIGGIQKFLFNIYKSSEAAEAEFSIAKALRGRSFFLSMVPEIFARYILDKLGYPITNALYIGGGKFQLLIGNTENNRKQLEEIEKEINEYLFKEFELELNFSLATWSFKGKEFKQSNGFLNQIEYLQQELDRKKKQKIGELLFIELERLEEATKELCPSCKTLKIEENSKFCKWCDLSQKIGSQIPKISHIAFTKNSSNSYKTIINLGNFGKVVLLSKEEINKIKREEFNEVLLLNEPQISDKNNGFKFLGNTVPIITNSNIEILLKYSEDNIPIAEGNVLPFEVLVKFAQGDKKLGYFRADVDNLGLIFSDGLRHHETKTGEDESLYTISRIAFLSRMLDLFFSGYLNKLAEETTQEYLKELIEIIEKTEKENKPVPFDRELKDIIEDIRKNNLKENFINSLIYIVYSGGDDLFIIAPYNLALKFAQKIREEFTEFTAKNKEFGLSGGLLLARHNLPINLVAKYAENLEEKAKEGTKDKIAIFQKAYKWKDFGIGEGQLSECDKKENEDIVYFSELEKIADDFEELYNEKIVSRAFLYNLLKLYKLYVEQITKKSSECKKEKETVINHIIYPKLHYQIARNVNDKGKEYVRNKLILPLLDINNKWILKNLDTIVSFVLMKTRRGG